ncbi:MAG: hypothetical protein KC496_12270, partial [Anaerolineae bacterium]|nr:hypothetical protein [Anaerolineae bacterium]
MLDMELIREKPEWVREQLLKLNDESAAERIGKIVELDEKRRAKLKEVEEIQSHRNTLNKLMGRLRGNKKMDEPTKASLAISAAAAIMQGDLEKAAVIMGGDADVEALDATSAGAKEEFDGLIAAMRGIGDQVETGFGEIKEIEAELQEEMYWLPNLPHESVPVAMSEEANVAWEPEGTMREFDFEPKAHWDIGTELGIIDFERGVKLAGSRFYILAGWGARLQRALINLYLDMAQEKGFTQLYVPHMVHADALYGSGQFPKFQDTVYYDEREDYYFLPTAEVAIANMHADEIFDEEQLPLYYVAHTPCYRREKTSAGRDTRGIKRGHQ